MRGIAKLLFGGDAGRLFDLLGDGNERDMADRARRAGEWCGTTPGRGPAAGAVRPVARPHGIQHQIVVREFRDR